MTATVPLSGAQLSPKYSGSRPLPPFDKRSGEKSCQWMFLNYRTAEGNLPLPGTSAIGSNVPGSVLFNNSGNTATEGTTLVLLNNHT